MNIYGRNRKKFLPVEANGLTSSAIHVRQRHQSRWMAEGRSEKRAARPACDDLPGEGVFL
jgi:hypothetical protein